MMAVEAARRLHDGTVCFVGIGLPSLAATWRGQPTRRDCVLIYESGTIGAKPTRLPLSIGDGELAETADTVVSVPEMFGYWLQGGRIDVGFLGAAQIDRFGNLNSTVIGDYDAPKVRLPGAGGAPEIATQVRDVFVMLRQTTAGVRRAARLPPSLGERVRVVSPISAFWSRVTGPASLRLQAMHPGVDLDDVRAATGWDLDVADNLAVTRPPSESELVALRRLQQARG